MSKLVTRRKFLGGAGAAVGTAVLVACAKEKVLPTAVPPTAVPQTIKPTATVGTPGVPVWVPPDLSGKEFLFWGLKYDPHIATYERLAKKFEGYTGAKATVEPVDWPIEQKVITGLAAGIIPDVACIMGKQISPLVTQGLLQELDGSLKGMGANLDTWFSPVAKDAYTRKGKMYGVPAEGNCTSGIVNVLLDEVKKLGLQSQWPPLNGKDGFASFEDMWALAKDMMLYDDAGNVLRWGLSGEGWYSNQFLGILLTLGGQYYDPGTDKVTLTTPEAIEAMNLLAYKPVFELKIDTQLGKGGQENMNANAAAMAAGNVTGTPTGLCMVDPPINIDSCLYPPAIPGATPKYVGEGGWGFVATNQGKSPDVALEFLKFVATYEGNKEYCYIYGCGGKGGIVSGINAVNTDKELFPPGTLLGDSMARGGKAQKFTTFYNVGDHNPSDLVGALNAATEAVRVGELEPKEALEQAQKQIDEAFQLS